MGFCFLLLHSPLGSYHYCLFLVIFISFFLSVPLVRFSLNDVDFDFFCCLLFLFNSQMIFLLLSSLTRINTNYGSNNPKKIHIIFYIKNQTIIIIIILYTTTKKR